MYVSLYTAKQLRKIKDRMLWLGLFMSTGGAASVLHNILLAEQTRWYWALAALLIMAVGVILIAVGTDRVQLRTAYFSISPSLISYRLNFYSPEHLIDWRHVSAVYLCDNCVLFDLHGGKQKSVNFLTFQSSNLACHVGLSIQAAALARAIAVNGVHYNTSSAAN
ncbi:hypothetical protein [uncultured Pontibacter sp.]|uniref:hypothetical protein n=1 Tax=uncultured Pontibacter sp. TaxID=453356 RepID=UPI0026070620|nr:hypothetical protein [uncultured Pontibacter sp.]